MLDAHTINLGKLIVNYHSLEFAIRALLSQAENGGTPGPNHGIDPYQRPVGTLLAEDALTNYDSLTTLITKANKHLKKHGQPELSSRLIEVRDAIAHGRVSADSEGGVLRLLKFDRPQDGNVRIAFNEIMDEAWLSTERKRISDAILSIRPLLDSSQFAQPDPS